MNNSEILNLIREILEKTTLSVKDISILDEENKTTWFLVEVENPHPVLARGGEGLFALNHLIKKIVENKISVLEGEEKKPPSILVDINGFQRKRIENIHAIAHMMAERARYFKSNIEVDPMPAFERRIIHEFLAEAQDLKTESTGEGLARRVVIKYIGGI